ncbi:NAD(P)-dependent oxidoreductase [Macrococcoides caseolyticum]|uniref:NAD(P)-dependent oxidoreductase n=1 Tax=Macrococcoides caseolyticum TaxID=69966 RepID=UPI001F3E7439|nr:NAD(P)-dependent oxidoreductase [Macrococcus caseolyticus]MCE4956450.1 NAD(P)-dependent oxidoreductase [Macrococcus caseolyticus]
MKIGFIGTGVMGQSMAMHLGEELFIHNRTKAKAQTLIDNGALWCESPKEVVQSADVIFTMLGYPHDVEAIYLGENGLITHGRAGQILIDCTTSRPELAKRIFEAGQRKSIEVLDAPVSGGDIGAKNATLSIMVGGNETTFTKMLPLFERIGQSITYFGQAGSGQHTKMANQIAIATNMIGVAESLYYAKSAGLDVERVLKTITGGAAGSWSLSNLAPRMLKEDYAPGFYTHHFLKDMGIAINECKKMNIQLPGLQLAYELYESLSQDMKQTTGTQVIYKMYHEK